jgi:hypothetical protein
MKKLLILIVTSVQEDPHSDKTFIPPVKKKRSFKHNHRLLMATPVSEMAIRFSVSKETLSEAILNTPYSKGIDSLWQQPLPLSERCKNIYDAISPLTEELSIFQAAGLTTLSRALYLNPNEVERIARKKSNERYFEKFLGTMGNITGETFSEKFESFKKILTLERQKFFAS